MIRFFIKIHILALLVWGLSAQAATLSVIRDGSGEFTRIQPALDACASGDTLLIGPGEYFEYGQYQWEGGIGQDVDVYAFIDVEDLTIIGAGAEETIIGPRQYYGSYATESPQVMVMADKGHLSLRGLTIRNGFVGLNADRVTISVSECGFVDNVWGLLWFADGDGFVEDTHFEASLWPNSFGFAPAGEGSVATVSNCDFVGARIEDYFSGELHVSGCSFSDSPGGISVGGSPSYRCFVTSSEMINSRWCIYVNQGGSLCSVSDCTLTIEGNDECVRVQPYSRFSATGTVFSGGGDGVIKLNNAGEVSVSGSHLLSNSEYAIYTFCNFIEPTIYDFRNNYWGTDDPAMIEAMILDSNDDPNNNCTVLFDPYSDVPVSTESTTLDALKALYR